MGDARGLLRQALLPAVLLLAAGAAGARAQISPGPLARPHASLEGTFKCTQCHAGRKMETGRACLACHKEVAWLQARDRGLHARTGSATCASCHPDHAGTDFALVNWPEGSPERFDHDRAGWTLRQSHVRAACNDCHAAKYRVSPAAALAPARGGGRWTGLETTCTACHADPHDGALGRDCTSCHDAGKWEVTPGFSHADTRYPLSGAHDTVSCDGCHLPDGAGARPASAGGPRRVYRPLPHAECSDCHADPHRGGLGAGCGSCHSTRGFRVVDRRRFDHDRTRYPLRGQHAAVRCAACHQPGWPAGRQPRFATCTDCHADAHAGTATRAGRPAGCESCHRVEGWSPSTYTVAEHGRARYALEGAHREVRCADCHVRAPAGRAAAGLGTAGVQLRPRADDCTACHADPHDGRFAARGAMAVSGGCAACHGMTAFRPAAITVEGHERFAFRLEGAHRATPCESCHAALRAPAARPARKGARATPVALTVERRACADCHETPHGDQFAGVPARGCDACHDSERFAPAPKFDHDRDARFKLAGAHARVACGNCHPAEPAAGGGRQVRYRPLASRCQDCHAEADRARERPGGVR